MTCFIIDLETGFPIEVTPEQKALHDMMQQRLTPPLPPKMVTFSTPGSHSDSAIARLFKEP